MTFRLGLCAVVALAVGWNAQAFAAPAVAKPVVTNKTRFRIPFRFDAAALARMQARELRLYVSVDQGRRWELAQSISAQSGKFEFQAPGDGEYRFAVKTLDSRNQLHPPGDTYETGLIVIVDTTTPELRLDLRQITPGKVELSWKATDASLDTSTLRLEYTQPGTNEWQTVSIVARPSGQTSWSVPTGGSVAVRGVVADQAGNQGEAQAQAQIEPAANGNAAPRRPDPRDPVAQAPVIAPVTAPEESPIVDRFTSVPHPFVQPIHPRPAQEVVERPVIRHPAVQFPLAQQEPVVERTPVAITHRMQFTSETNDSRPEITQNRWAELPMPTADEPPAAPVEEPRRLRMVNSRKFQIGYQVDDVGPSGVGGVELYITQDQGRKWWKYGDDPDHQSPFDVEVPQDGEYGFAVRARSGVGLADDPPAPNEPPAIVVMVDQTPPKLEMLPIRQGTGSHLHQLQLRWRISDAHPAEKPVALYYSATLNGPWETISDWKADTGEHVWTVGTAVPAQVYFRIVARDAVGNISQEQTPRPVIVDLARPSARIVDIEATSVNVPK